MAITLVERVEAGDLGVGADRSMLSWSARARAGRRMPFTSELLPAPLTP